MKYKLELITDPQKLETLISNAEEKIFILKNDRDDKIIQSNRGQKLLERRTRAITESQARLTTATTLAATMPDGPQKSKQLGIIETQRARLFNLNLPGDVNSEEEVIDVEIEKEEQVAMVAFWEEVLSNLNARKTELA